MKDNISPEEKLLRLIKGQKKQALSAEDKQSIHPGAQALKPAVKLTLHNLPQKYLYFFDARKILLGVFILSCVYLGVSLVYPWLGLKKISLPKVTPERAGEPKQEPKEQVKALEFYKENMGGRQLFNSAGSSQPNVAVNVDLLKDINLVGIITGANPQAVIEDKKSLRTYYVNKGQFIGEIQVEDIQEGKIIINYRGQKYELYL